MSEVLDHADRATAGEKPTKRQQILAGAHAVFSSLGFDVASMDDVVKAAKVSKSTLYVYFRSKEELFTALIQEERERYFQEIGAIFTDPGHPAETLRIYGGKLARKLTSPEAVRANRTVIGVVERMPELGRSFYESGPQRAIKLLTAYLDSAVAAGTLRIEDTELAAKQFIELASAGIMRCRLFGYQAGMPDAAEIERTVDAAVWLFMQGYGTKA
ncbi:TetR/AcrR family transcriptional regulator [Aureimonas leprariae]|nr:TetR/AcrR family transcriptional regulator [Aureimonas leprariae]